MSISCGHCHGSHGTVFEVKICSGHTEHENLQAKADLLVPGVYELPTGEKYAVQRSTRSGHNYAKRYMPETHRFEYAPGEIARISPENLVAGKSARPDPEAGVYQNTEGSIISVKKAVHGSGKMVARRLILPGTPRDGAPQTVPAWLYLGLARDYIAGYERMTLEEARQFGQLYGICCVCGAVLTDPKSIADGIGPDCGKKQGFFLELPPAPEWTLG